jgi:carboxymethylenebutenolidase
MSAFRETNRQGQAMTETKIDVQGADGTAEAYLYTPPGEAKHPAVLFLTDIMGVREANRGMAARVAEAGFTVLMPNIFYRATKLPVFDFAPKFGEERTMKRFGELRAALDNRAMQRDAIAYITWLEAQPSVKSGPMAVVGYCFTGAMAMRAAAARNDAVAFAASFHGGNLANDAVDSPHLLLPRIKARLMFGHAKDDHSMPAEMIGKLDAALKQWGGNYDSEVYNAAHGWTVPGVPAYNETEAEKHWAKLIPALKAALG